MAMKYETLGKGVTPKVPVFWVKVFEPDTAFVPEGEYSVKVILDEDSTEAQGLIAMFDEMTEKAFGIETEDLKPGLAKKWTAKPPYVLLDDPDTGEKTGMVQFTFKMKASGTNTKGKEWTRSVPVFDAAGVKINKMEGFIGNNSKGKVAFMVKSYANNKDKEVGISLKLTGFQLIELTGGGSDSAEDLGFGAENGGYQQETINNTMDADLPADDGPGGDF